MIAVIMAGGKGTRIASVRSDIPKPMIPVCGMPILEHQINCLKKNGFNDIILVIGHLGKAICDYFGDGSSFGVKISYFDETEPLGTAGALFKLNLSDDFLLLCGDIIFDMDLNRFMAFHKERGAFASLVSHPNNHPYDSSVLVTETLPPKEKGGLPIETGKVVAWLTKEDERSYYRNLVNAGIELISPKLLEETKKRYSDKNLSMPQKLDLDRDILKPAIGNGEIFAYRTTEYIKDMGTPDRLEEVETDIKSGKVASRNLAEKQKAIFLDRDGTINKKNGFITKTEQFELIDGVANAIKRINESNYLAVVVTNQPVIARGDCDFSDLDLIHQKLETELGKSGAYLDAIYICPHHTDKGFEGERPEYKCNCECRKPKPGMLLQAAKDLNIDLSKSYMIGDSENDILAGKNAGCKKSILLNKEMNLKKAIGLIPLE